MVPKGQVKGPVKNNFRLIPFIVKEKITKKQFDFSAPLR